MLHDYRRHVAAGEQIIYLKSHSKQTQRNKDTMVEARKLTEATLPLSAGDSSRLYHIDAGAEMVARNVLIVGDPNRVDSIAKEHMLSITSKADHRGLKLVTGLLKNYTRKDGSPLEVTVCTSGMGTPSLEIVVNELVALNEIELPSRKVLPKRRHQINIIRVGTSGAVSGAELGTSVITQYAIGMDNTGLFYDFPSPDANCTDLERQTKAVLDRVVPTSSRFYGAIHPYASRAHPEVFAALMKSADTMRKNQLASSDPDPLKFRAGITVSNSGFFAPQGRVVSEAPSTVQNIDQVLRDIALPGGVRVSNFEMEASFLLHFMGGLNYRAGVVCTAIADRPKNAFAKDIPNCVRLAVNVALGALEILDRSNNESDLVARL
eukprot:TRINITY_DN7440_c0_g1_i1.p1 TRINITY_DN7440_c0_g1~~TRINITY_DN7440_c0_g1_i1.p1  ORF type:complete len:378 (+),score=104.60 TRINITY_DN7440_c0_g1_i1:9-1142(+)